MSAKNPTWPARGLLTRIYERVGGRDALATISGIGGTSLSSINGGDRPLSLDAARKIMAAVPGTTLLELGAPLGLVEDDRNVYDRLEELVTQAEAGRAAVIENLASIDARLSRIERSLGLPDEAGSAAHP